MGSPSAWAAANDTQASPTPPGFREPPHRQGGRLCRGAMSPGAFCQYLSGSAAVETAGEEIAAAHADGDPIGPRCESTESLNLGINIWAALLPLRQPAKSLRRPMRTADPSGRFRKN